MGNRLRGCFGLLVGLFDHFVALTTLAHAPGRPSRRFSAGFRPRGRCANHRQKSRHTLTHPTRRPVRSGTLTHPTRRPVRSGLGLLPRQPHVGDEWPGQPELPGEQGHQVAPTFGLLWGRQVRQRPMQVLLGKPVPVIHGEAPQVPVPPGRQRGRFGPVPAQPEHAGVTRRVCRIQAFDAHHHERLVGRLAEVQPAPDEHLHPAQIRIRQFQLAGGLPPGERLAQLARAA